MALALPGALSAPSTPKKNKDKKKSKPKKKDEAKEKDLESDAELEVSAEDLVAEGEDADDGGDDAGEDGDADGDADGDGDGEEEGGDEGGGKRKRVRRDEDEEEEAQVLVSDMGNVKREAKRRRDEIFLFRGALDEEQAKRFDAFRSAVIPKAAIKKINKDLYDQNIPTTVTSVVAGMVKVFVADVVEMVVLLHYSPAVNLNTVAREIQKHSEHPTGPLRPYHLQLARMRLQEQGVLGAPAGVGTSRSSTGLRARRPLFRR